MAKHKPIEIAPAETPPAIVPRPPRPNRMLLGLSVLGWCAWLSFLIWLAVDAR